MPVLTVYHQKGGVGKTTAAVNLAVALAAGADRRVAIIDADPQGSATDWYAARTEHPRDRLAATVTVVSAGSDLPAAIEAYAPGDVVLIDAGGWDSEASRTAILVSDTVLVPQLPRALDLWSLERVSEAVLRPARGRRPGLRLVGFLNRAETIAQS